MYKDNESIFFFLNFGKKKREVQKTCGAIKSGIKYSSPKKELTLNTLN
jgi:hypothetical protein